MSAPAARTRDPALGLLDRLIRDALDPAYQEAAARRGAPTGVGRPRWRRHWIAGLGLVLMTAVLALATTQQLVTAPEAAARKKDLAAAVDARTASIDSLQAQVIALAGDIEALQSTALGSDAAGQQLQAQLGRLSPMVGTAAVSGAGVVVTLDDAPAGAATDPDLGRVLDRDLQQVVNGLWQAGATAVDVNGQRLTGLSAIRAAGDALLVNYRPLVRPYVVTAVGDSKTLGSRFASGPAGSGLETLHQTYGIRYQVDVRDRVTVPGEPVTQLRYASEVVS